MSRHVVFLLGSPSVESRSAWIANTLANAIQRTGLVPRIWSLIDFDPADVFFGRAKASTVARFVEETTGAAALVLATPVYKATYSGALKGIVDLIPPDGLVDRPALGIATARLAEHVQTVDISFRALFAFFRARSLGSLTVLDDELTIHGGSGALSDAAARRVEDATTSLVAAIEGT
ncbi:MAG: NAD(P)H-dependent oxidoreductase [Polyangiaceae bacterium]|jgi:FMN reductase